MYAITIHKNGTRKFTTNFTEREFYSHSPDAPASHTLDARLIDVAQFVREEAGVPVYITSTARFPKDKDYSESSQHAYRKAKAIDLGAAKAGGEASRIAQLFHREILSQGPVFRKLWELGVRGFGLYDTFMHFDVRSDGSGKMSFNGQPYALWDHRSIKSAYGSSTDAGNVNYVSSAKNVVLNSFKRYEDEEDRSFFRAVLLPIIIGLALFVLFFQIFQQVQLRRMAG